MATGTMTSKGQITVPKDVREALGLTAGTRVDFRFEHGSWTISTERSRRDDADAEMDAQAGQLAHGHGRQTTADATRSALAREARQSAITMQDSMSVAVHAERSLASTIRALSDDGLDAEAIADAVGLHASYVAQLLDGGRASLKLL